MKKLLFLFISLAIIGCESPYKYKVYDSSGNAYGTNYYQINGTCITFENDCGCEGDVKDKLTICGSFKIKENKNYKKTTN